MRFFALFLTFWFLAGCFDKKPEEYAGAAIVNPRPDSLVLTMPDSAEVWLTGTATSMDSGSVCLMRSVEIRRGGAVIAVPLLYTVGAPTIEDDTTIRAVLYRNCVPVDDYLVNTKTGQPRRDQ